MKQLQAPWQMMTPEAMAHSIRLNQGDTMGPVESPQGERRQTWAVLYAVEAARYAAQTAQTALDACEPVYGFSPPAILALQARASTARLALEHHVAESLKWRREPDDPSFWQRFLTFAGESVQTEHQTD